MSTTVKVKQEIFDTVTKALLNQFQKCEDSEGKCKYRHEELKCAAGHLIPDELYNHEWEGLAVQPGPEHIFDKTIGDKWTVFNTMEVFGKNYTYKEIDLIRKLQRIHDQHKPVEWNNLFAKLAKAEGLVYGGSHEQV